MKKLFLLVSLFSSTLSWSQNLVSNHGFDTNNGCPSQIGQIDKSDGWSVWGGTPDYFHSCSNGSFPFFGTPVNNRGFQVPHSGDAYIGLFTFSVFTPNLREFVGRALASPLIPGQSYHVSFWVNRADSSLISHATNNIGIRFTTSPHSLIDPDTALNNAHVFESSVIHDTANWTQVSGVFVADSAYTHIGIGNYFSDAATIVIPGAANSNYAYYLIDDVCVSSDPAVCGIKSGVESSPNSLAKMLYPNPANDYFILEAIDDMEGTISIYDMFGRRMFEESLKLRMGDSKSINISSLLSGIYNVIIAGEHVNYSGKLLKVKTCE